MRQFRKAKPEDAKAIELLYQQLVTDPAINVQPNRIETISQRDNTYLIVCEEKNNIIATALITLCDDVMYNQQPFALIENIVVDIDYRREGVGKSLADHIEEYALSKDCSKIMLLSSVENRNAHDFFAAMGYDPDKKLGFVKYRKYFNQ